MNIFHAFGEFFESLLRLIFSPAGRAKIEGVLLTVKDAMPKAIEIVKDIDALVPNRAAEELVALAEKYQAAAPVLKQIFEATDDTPERVVLHVLDKQSVQNFLMNVAVAELRRFAPGLSTSTLNTAINFAVSLIRNGQ